MRRLLKISSLGVFSLFAAGCATQAPQSGSKQPATTRVRQVRTTAYTHSERGGPRNAIGTRLSGRNIKSASADWSRWPLGTKFRIVQTDEVFRIDDYGGALVGTGTIDLYKTNRFEMNKWGVRQVDIDVLEWGSNTKSLEVLAPRARNPKVHAMIVSLNKKPSGRENPHLSPAFF